jgi:hypothetical protein
MHFDALNQPIEVGDKVLACRTGSNYPKLSTVTNMTDKTVRIDGSASKDPKTMVVITKQLEYAKETWPEWFI